MIATIQINNPLDMHLHLRQGEMLKQVAPFSAKTMAGAVIMPNLAEPVITKEQLYQYRDEILKAIGEETFSPYMTLFFKDYTEKELLEVKKDIIGIKLYPAGITTNSESGVKEFTQTEKTLFIMMEMGIPLLVHGESNGFVMDREKEFLYTLEFLCRQFPDLKIIMEHITTREAIEFLDKYDNLFATVTLHHLLITLDDVAGGLLSPHLYCKPIAKRPEDKAALLKAILNGHPKIMFGSDSAPHPLHKKECSGCAAGIFTAPVILPMLVELFEKHNKLENLPHFTSTNAQKIYNISPPAKTITLIKKDWVVPDTYNSIVPFYAGKTLSWDLA